MKLLVSASLVWISAVFLYCLFHTEILWIYGLVLYALLALSGLVLVIVWLSLGFRRSHRKLGATMALLCVSMMVLFAFTPYGHLLGTYFKFYRHLGEYEAVVADIARLDTSDIQEMAHYSAYIVDKGPPVRVAFVWDGFGDNWSGVVYDPSGEVMQANEFKRDWSNWSDPKLQRIKRLFGGDLRSARRLWRSWYLCSFT